MIILRENKIYININVIDKKIKTVYRGKFLTSESLCDLRKQLKIKNEYKFLSEDGEFILLSQENEYRIIDILVNESDIVLKYDISYENSFSNKEIELIQNYYYLRVNDKKTYKIKLNHDFFLSEVRNKIDFNDIGNYFFLNLKGLIIRQIDENNITIKSISFAEDNKIFVNLIVNKPIQSSTFIKIENNLKIYRECHIYYINLNIYKIKNLVCYFYIKV